MELKPIIASHSGDAFARIRQYLNEDVLSVIGSVARAPRSRGEVAGDVLAELVEMHVLRERGGRVVPDTSVFLEEDVASIVRTVKPLAEELAHRVFTRGAAFHSAPPELTLFLAGVVGLVQGLGTSLREQGVGLEWRSYGGKYARSKVDFDQVCEAYDAVGPDYLNKTILPGEHHTAVFIGPGGTNFCLLVRALKGSETSQRYVGSVDRYLVDAYAMLAKGEIQSENLRSAAAAADLFRERELRTVVVTRETMDEYGAALAAIVEDVSSYYIGQLGILHELLSTTTPGRQGVPPGNMMLNLWGYIRKLTAAELYGMGFFTDSIPETGMATVFYENDVDVVPRLFA